jgi:hypothetical protein
MGALAYISGTLTIARQAPPSPGSPELLTAGVTGTAGGVTGQREVGKGGLVSPNSTVAIGEGALAAFFPGRGFRV